MREILHTIFSIALCMTLASCGSGNDEQQQPVHTQDEQQEGTYSEVSETEFRQMWQDEEGMLLDVRTPEEFGEAHLPGAMLIDYLADDFSKEIASLDKDTTYLLYCRSGQRSGLAGKEMAKRGLKVVNMKGGIVGWQNKGYEMEE